MPDSLLMVLDSSLSDLATLPMYTATLLLSFSRKDRYCLWMIWRAWVRGVRGAHAHP